MGKFSRLGNQLYSGERSIDFVGRKWLWYSISGVILVAAILGLSLRGLNLGIEFKGGTQYTVSVPAAQVNQSTVDRLSRIVVNTHVPGTENPVASSNGSHGLLITVDKLSQDQSDKVITAITKGLHVKPDSVSPQSVGASWGAQVANKALTGLIVFLVLVVLFIWIYFREWKMSAAALVALAHDLLITVGIYSLSGFQVSPATVTGLLTILGFSLYDTVVVFDKIRENTKNLQRKRNTYGELANLALNQTLVRSINTSIVALLPVLALLIVGIVALGSGELKDLSLALFVGMASGTYSSIFIATPLLVHMKQGEKQITEQARRAKARQRRVADRYADVPTGQEEPGMGLDTMRGAPAELAEDDERPSATIRPVSPPRREESSGSGRVPPEPKGPVTESGASRRNQPRREPRSKRHK